MRFDLSACGRVTMNGWVQIPCPLSTLARWPLWAVSGQYNLIASNSGLSSVCYRQVSVMDRCPLRKVLLYFNIICNLFSCFDMGIL